ncbi:MAG: prolyl oligopeptidase family serine peptidase [Caulobacteraceae bacterium]
MKPSNVLGLLVLALACAGGARAAEPPVHRFLEAVISPDGAWVASVEGDTSASGAMAPGRELIIRGLNAPDNGFSAPVKLPCAGQAQCWPSSLAWYPDSARLVFALRTPGTHARSLYRLTVATGALTRLIQFDGTIEGLRVLSDGRLAMLATAGATKEVGATQAGAPITGDLGGPTPEQRIGILAGGALQFVSPPDLYVYEYDAAPDGSFVGTAAPGNGDDNWWTAKLYRFSAGGAQVLYAPPNARSQIAHPRVSRDGRQVAFISGLMSDFGATGGDVFVAPLAGGVASDVTPGLPASATSLAWGCDGALLAELDKADHKEIVRLRPDGHAPDILWSGRESLDGPDAGVSLACPSSRAVAIHQSFTAPPQIEFGRIGAWVGDLTHFNSGLAQPFTVRSLDWRSGGFNVQGWLLLPADMPANARLPMITIIHGGPAAAVTPRYVAPGLDRTLLERGYALFLHNPRGSFGQGEAFTLANVRDFGHGDLNDIMAGVDAAIAAAPIDPNRLGLMGGSYGGYMTMWAVTQTHRFKAAVAAAGISDWLSYYGENGIDQWMIPYFGKSVYDDPAVYARSSPIEFIKNVTTPTFEYVGAQDIECPFPQTQEFWHALHDLGVPTSMAIYPGEGHGLREAAHVADAERRTLEWFDRYLK